MGDETSGQGEAATAGDAQAGSERAGETSDETQGGSGRSRVEFTDEQQKAVSGIVAREVEKASARAAAQAKAEQDRKEAEAKGEYQKLLAAAEKERDDARSRVRVLEAQSTVERVARKAGAEHPEIVHRLIRDDLTYDADGKPSNADDLVARLKKDYPRYFVAGASGADAGKSGKPAGGDDMNQMIRKAAGRG